MGFKLDLKDYSFNFVRSKNVEDSIKKEFITESSNFTHLKFSSNLYF